MKPVAFGLGAGLGLAAVLATVIVVLWASIWPWLVVGIATAILAPSLLAAIYACKSIVQAYNAPKPSQDTPSTADTTEHGYSVPPIEQAALQEQWNVSGLQLAVISMHKNRSCSSRSLYPYITENQRLYWEWFVETAEALGFVEKRKKQGYVWKGSYKRFSEGILKRTISLRPRPGLTPPVIRWIGGSLDTLGTANTENTRDTVTISPGRIVYRG